MRTAEEYKKIYSLINNHVYCLFPSYCVELLLEHDEGFRELHYDAETDEYEEVSQYWLVSDFLASLFIQLGSTVFQMGNGNVFFRHAYGMALADDRIFLDAVSLIDGTITPDNEQIEKK